MRKRGFEAAGFLALERRSSLEFARRRGNPALAHSAAGALERFRGLEGLVWPGDTAPSGSQSSLGLVSPDLLHLVTSYYRTLRRVRDIELLWCQFGDLITAPCTSPTPCAFRGFDLVLTPLEVDAYSSILSEVVVGSSSEMGRFRVALNDYLLLPAVGLVLELQAVREDLAARRSKDLETADPDESFECVAVYGVTGM